MVLIPVVKMYIHVHVHVAVLELIQMHTAYILGNYHNMQMLIRNIHVHVIQGEPERAPTIRETL